MRSWLYVPGNRPKMIIQAGIYGSDGIVLDLEDSVSLSEKDEARFLVAEALKEIDFGAASVVVRINDLEKSFWKKDVSFIAEAGAKILRIPKVETPEPLKELDDLLNDLEVKNNIKPGTIKYQTLIETPMGVENAFAIAGGSERLIGICFGAEDYCTAMNIPRRGPVFALDYPRSRIASCAAAMNIESYDTVWPSYQDNEGLKEDCLRSKALGFTGKAVIHPSQIDIVNHIFSPSEKDIHWAEEIIAGLEKNRGGVYGLKGSMVDLPVIKRARNIISIAGIQNENNKE